MGHAVTAPAAGLAGTAVLAALALVTTPSAAQTTADAAPDGALAITAAEVRHHIAVIAHDSMQGRDTPSPGLEKTAQYVAGQFRALGLQPAGDPVYAGRALNGISDGVEIPWLQRYPLPGTARASPQSIITFYAHLRTGALVVDEQGRKIVQETPVDFTTAARFAADTIPASGGADRRTRLWRRVRGRMQVLTGRHTPESIRRAHLDQAVALYVPPAGLDSATERQIVRAITATSDVVVLADEDSATFAARRAKAFEHPPVFIDEAFERRVRSHWAAYVWCGAVSRFLDAAQLDLARLRADTMPHVQEVPSILVLLEPTAARVDSASGVNAAAALPGTDSLLSGQVIVISAHMDHTGVTPGSPARSQNGANDNASGVAGLVALAKAFSQPGVRPRRPLLFVATSGGAWGKGEWGADAFAGLGGGDVVYRLNLTLDRIGRVPGDSLRMSGLADFDFATRPEWLAAQHPELGLKLVDGGAALMAASDHLAFLQRGVPSLYVRATDHADPATASDTIEGVDAEQEVRALRLLYYVIQDLANGSRLPRWTPGSPDQGTPRPGP